MGGFLSTIFSSLFGRKEVRVLILGLDNAGKTTILCACSFGAGVGGTDGAVPVRAPPPCPSLAPPLRPHFCAPR
jgi:hypothetical protein